MVETILVLAGVFFIGVASGIGLSYFGLLKLLRALPRGSPITTHLHNYGWSIDENQSLDLLRAMLALHGSGASNTPRDESGEPDDDK